MRISEFFDNDFKDFSNLDNVRSIPSLIDGLKDSQRKAVYGMLNNGNGEIKVAQASGKFSLLTHYSHGESSMADTIVGLAQNYPGSNNVNLFEPIGQFGSILSSSSSAHRYIFTKPSQNLRTYFRPDDEIILEYKYEDGDQVEPKVFYPVLPMWILNGTLGIGTGHSVKILPRDPKKIVKLVSKLAKQQTLSSKEIDDCLMPYYEGWKGTVDKLDVGSYQLSGCIEKINTTKIRITEVPPNMGIDKVKENLIKLMDAGKIKDYDNNSSESGFNIVVSLPRNIGTKSDKELLNIFKLTSRVTENVTLWSCDGYLGRYDSVYDAIQEFVCFKLLKVEARRVKLIEILNEDLKFLKEKMLFIQEWNTLDTKSMTTYKIEEHMLNKSIREESVKRLMSLRISSLAMDQIEHLQEQIKNKKSEIIDLGQKDSGSIYLSDLKQI